MFCPECGTKIEDSNRFCPECGTKIEEVKVNEQIVTTQEELSTNSNEEDKSDSEVFARGILFTNTNLLAKSMEQSVLCSMLFYSPRESLSLSARIAGANFFLREARMALCSG